MKLLLDMNLSSQIVDVLTDAGHHAAYWGMIGKRNAEDGEILTWAQENGYVILTNDLDFGTILATTGFESPSIIQIRRRNVRPEVIAPLVLQVIEKFTTELEAGALIVVDEYRYRVRLLPIG